MFKKFFIPLLAAAILAMPLSGCSGTADAVAGAVSNAVGQILSGNVVGQVGKAYSTQWFTFTVKSIEKVDSYAGYTPAAGNELYDVLITETGTFEEASPMGTFDFYMDEDSFEDYIFPMDPLDDTMMPTDFMLDTDETVEYHMVYEVPTGLTGLRLMYTEFDDQDNEGVTFTINIK